MNLEAFFISGTPLNKFRSNLLEWYDQRRRELPWRGSSDPYLVWVSEIMLQQTRVAAVLNHFGEFLIRFPTVSALASASEDSVLAAWSGLGYYRRARMMHAAARQIMQKHGGFFPRDSAELRRLPGIGRYTAAAISSIAFGEPVAVVDGNVARLLSRVLPQSPKANLSSRHLWDSAMEFLDPGRPGDFNQAMMELGATICLPRAPLCDHCPVQGWCETRRTLRPLARPGRSRRQQQKKVFYGLAVSRQSILLSRRSKAASIMPAMWELPELASPPMAALRGSGNLAAGIAAFRGSKPARTQAADQARPLLTLKHSITNTDYDVAIFRLDGAKLTNARQGIDRARNPVIGASPGRVQRFPTTLNSAATWVAFSDLVRIPLTGLARKVLRHLQIIGKPHP